MQLFTKTSCSSMSWIRLSDTLECLHFIKQSTRKRCGPAIYLRTLLLPLSAVSRLQSCSWRQRVLFLQNWFTVEHWTGKELAKPHLDCTFLFVLNYEGLLGCQKSNRCSISWNPDQTKPPFYFCISKCCKEPVGGPPCAVPIRMEIIRSSFFSHL